MPSGSALLPLPPRTAFEHDRSRRDRDDADLILRQLLRQRLGEADLRGLDRVVGHAAARLAAEDRRDDDDRAAAVLAHVRHREPRHANGGKQRVVERLLPLGIAWSSSMSAPLARPTLFTTHVDAAELASSAVSTTGDAGLRRHVGSHAIAARAPAAADCPQLFRRLLERVGSTRADRPRARPRRSAHRAAPRPNPRLPPVTIATFPVRSEIHSIPLNR